MNDDQIGRKEAELEQLQLFLDARAHAIGERMALVRNCESPDFVVATEGGQIVGVELSQITRGPVDAFWDHVIYSREVMDPYDCVERTSLLIEKKTRLRERYANSFDATILVLLLMDGMLDSLRQYLCDVLDDSCDVGFSEIWIAGCFEKEAYGDVDLLCLCPLARRGYYQRQSFGAKPYG